MTSGEDGLSARLFSCHPVIERTAFSRLRRLKLSCLKSNQESSSLDKSLFVQSESALLLFVSTELLFGRGGTDLGIGGGGGGGRGLGGDGFSSPMLSEEFRTESRR